MASFAKIDDNGLVLSVLYVLDSQTQNSEGVEVESIGQAHLQTHNNWPADKWIKTSYNTYGNQHLNGGTAFRGNYAQRGGTYDATNEIFWPIQPHSSWSKDIASASWVAPIAYPSITSEGSGENKITYRIGWNEAMHQADSTKGWVMSKSNDNASPLTKYDWNGTEWVSR